MGMNKIMKEIYLGIELCDTLGRVIFKICPRRL